MAPAASRGRPYEPSSIDRIEAAKIQDDVVRRDSLHAIINALPDPNYATLRALTLHLHRVIEHTESNRMTSSTLAVIFA